MTHVSVNNSNKREIIAKPIPSRLALSRMCGGKRPTKIEMKMMLSMPRTISKAANIAKAIQTFGSSRSSMGKELSKRN